MSVWPFIIFIGFFTAASFGLNAITRRLLGQTAGFGYWSINILSIPGILAVFAIWAYATYEPPLCSDGSYCGGHLAPIGSPKGLFVLTILLPLLSFCSTIPVTMWFSRRELTK